MSHLVLFCIIDLSIWIWLSTLYVRIAKDLDRVAIFVAILKILVTMSMILAYILFEAIR